MASARHLLLLLAWLGANPVCEAQTRYEPLAFPAPCGSNTYFDISALACLPCPSGQVPDGAGTGCVCAAGSVLGEAGCTSCSNASATTPNTERTECLSCSALPNSCAAQAADLPLSSGGICRCPAGLVLFDSVGRGSDGGRILVKRCRPCPSHAYAAGATETECVPCPGPNMVTNAAGDGCECDRAAGYRAVEHANGWWGRDVSCVLSAAYSEYEQYAVPASYRMTYDDLGGRATRGSSSAVTGVESKVLQQLLLPSAAACRTLFTAPAASATDLRYGNEGCQAIANLCVLNDYAGVQGGGGAAACEIYRELQQFADRTCGTPAASGDRCMPGLIYPDRGLAATSESAPALTATLALPPEAGSRLRYVLAAYTLNGTFVGLHELADELQLCSGGASNPSAYLDVGTGLRVQCDVPPAQLLSVTEPTFYELYLYYDTASAASASLRLEDITSGLLYPVPITVLNLRLNGVLVNAAGRPSFDDQLARRFFTVDAASAVREAGQLPRVLRYLKSATLTATLRTGNSEDNGFFGPNSILPPVLTIEYEDVPMPLAVSSPLAAEVALYAEGVTLPTSFEAVYTMQFGPSNETINYFFVISLVLWVLLTIGKTYLFFRRNVASTVDGYVMLRTLAQACSVFAAVFFTLLFCISLWWMIMFKGQSHLHFLMPIAESSIHLGLMPFTTFIVCIFVAKLLHVLDILYVQTQHDLFFIDWEQPRTLVNEKGDDDGDGGESAFESSDRAVPVSAWRTIFVANEWVKLQEVRAISCEINLIVLLFLLEGCHLDHAATLVPNSEASDQLAGVPMHPVLRFAISSALLLASSLVQFLVRWVLWERCVKDRLWQFVDLLAVTNISCLLLEEPNFGFYLHGRSVHDHADADMAQLNAHLKREEEGLEMLRGFRQDSHIQTFEIYLSPKVRQKYDAAFVGTDFSSAPPSRRRAPSRNPAPSNNPRHRGFRAAPEEGLKRHRNLNRFLMGYLGTPSGGSDGGSSADGRLEVRAKTYWERLIGAPPDMGYSYDRSVFLEDRSGRFKRLLLAGRELDMVLLSLATYALVDNASSNTFVAIFFTYAVDVVVRLLRKELSTRNIAAKTLLDDRFLL